MEETEKFSVVDKRGSLTAALELGCAAGGIVGGVCRASARAEDHELPVGSPERSRWEREIRLARVALEHYGLHESRLGLRGARITPLARSRNYKSVFHLPSLRHGVFALYMYRLPEVAREEMHLSAEGLRCYEGRSTQAALRSQLLWVEHLGGAGLDVPEPVRTLYGSLICEASSPDGSEGRRCVLVRWAPGEAKTAADAGDLSPKALSAIGSYIGRMHRCSETFVAPEGFVRPLWDWDHVFGEAAPLWSRGGAVYSARELDVLHNAAERVRRNLQAAGESSRMFGLIHGDLLPKNVILRGRVVRKHQVRAVDFDHCGWGYYMYDLAWMLRAFGDHNGLASGVQAPQREALLEGYLSERPLAEGDLREHLLACSVLRAVEMVNRVLNWERPEARPWGPAMLSGALREAEAYLERNCEDG